VGHSFKPPLTFDNGLSSWSLSGASVSLEKFIQLVPPIPQKHGFFFHTGQIDSGYFITTVDFDVAPVIGASDPEIPTDQVFSIWYTAQNVSESLDKFMKSNKQAMWTEGLRQMGFGLNGVVPPNFSGFGLLFTHNGDITLVASDGSKPASHFESIIASHPKESSIRGFDFRKPGIKLTLSVNRERKTVSVYTNDGKGGRGQITVPVDTIPAKGYMGLSAFTGASSTGRPDRVMVKSMRSINLDMKSGSGEDTKKSELGDLEAKLEKKNLHIDDLITGEDAFSEDPEHQIKDVDKATSIISEYLSDTRFRDQSLVRSMSDLQSRADALEELINELRMEIKYTFAKGGASGDLVNEVRNLKDLMRAHSEDNKSIHELKEKIRASSTASAGAAGSDDPELYQKLLHANDELETEVANANFTANILIGVFGLVVMGMGFALYMKMRQYEKKHFL